MFFVNTLHLSVLKLKKKTFKLNEQQMSFFNDCLKNICEETNFLKIFSFIFTIVRNIALINRPV